MQLRNECLVVDALERYYKLEKHNPHAKNKHLFEYVVNEVRNLYRPLEDPSAFMSMIVNLKNQMRHGWKMSYIMRERKEGKDFFHISAALDKGSKKIEVTHDTNLLQEIAHHDLELIGGPDYATTDVMPVSELKIIGADMEEHEHYLAPQQVVTPPIKKKTLRSRAKQFHLYLNEQLELNFPKRKEFQFTH